ncbi:ABC transporter permease [Micromonospora sp. NBC_01813]|uniref:ABC transporter permease n=1 Tax=Micromonospora sp. NBC_01813 TaxID=2975988 RepID=UPI002DD93FAE|nr:ABC transporter permease [Micromonospora sp. NBC_01813]WSA06802.1 ABC transporter permease [Micromonospora sp. NBC_01813]
MTAPPSVYPKAIEDLMSAALNLTDELGEVPSRNRLMKEFRIGGPKARVLLDALAAAPVRRPVDPDPDTAPGPVDPASAPLADPDPAGPAAESRPVPAPVDSAPAVEPSPLVAVDGPPGTNITTTAPAKVSRRRRPHRSWPVLLLALPAFVAIWSGWVGLGELTGFGVVHPLPGIWDELALNTAITLPIGVEAYAAIALRTWLSPNVPDRARRFAKWSAIGSLLLGAAGQVAYHLMESAGITVAPWWITTLVSCLPVAVLGMGAALYHLIAHTDTDQEGQR